MRYFTTLLLSFTFVLNVQSQALDIDFGDNGISILDKYDSPGFEVIPVLDESGQMLLAGIPSPSFMNSKVFITKLNIDGSLDIDFGVDGYTEYDLGQGFVSMSDFIQLDNGNLIVSGTTFQDGWLIMFDAQGDLVTDFGDNGFFDTQKSADVNRMMITQVNDRIFCLHKDLIGGSSYLATSYYTMDGTYDTSYGNNGTIVYSELQFNALNEVAWDYSSNGDFKGAYFYGFSPNGEAVSFVSYVSSEGILSSSFSDEGLYRLSGVDFIYDMAIDFNNDLLLTGRNGNNYVIQKLDSQGDFVTDFGTDGSYTDTWSLPLNTVQSIIPVADGGFLQSGGMNEFSELKSVFQKHNQDGSVDDEVGEIIYDAQPIAPRGMVHADNGDIYIIGFTIVETSNIGKMFVIKYKSDITDVENIGKQTITISPNPSNIARWTLDKSVLINITDVKLLDISGKYILELEIDQNQIYTHDKVKAGLYILSITTTQGEVVNSQVVITK